MRQNAYEKEIVELREKLNQFKSNMFSEPYKKEIRDIEHIFDYVENLYQAKLKLEDALTEKSYQIDSLKEQLNEQIRPYDA